MDEGIRPGDHLLRNAWFSKIKKFFSFLGAFLIMCILYIPWLIFAVPCICASVTYDLSKKSGYRPIVRTMQTILAFCSGLVLDICFIPAALIGTLCAILVGIIYCMQTLFKKIFGPNVEFTNRNQAAADANMREAERRMQERLD